MLRIEHEFDAFIDLDSYDTIAFKLEGDGRCYMSTIYTEKWVNSPRQEEAIHYKLLFLFRRTTGTSLRQIPLERYLPTRRGNVINVHLEMNPSRVVGMSFSVNAEICAPGAKSEPGDFTVEIDWIKALRTQQ
ncbi:hypothetical protein Sjap_023898 [Stephania japonica]|uniref:NADH:ubiquinone oxidoreductase intermediate-associated protein 30 domain-containing protein n=1 Tax=Stephania japonica TaxID=461633 RepID=A0AAP0HNF7_9MAGN